MGNNMKIVHIKTKLEEIGSPVDSISLGTFDQIGEFTAKRDRKPDDPNFHKVGATYRSNYERGILVYNLIRKFNLSSMLEIGFGRGYTTFCAAKAFHDMGIIGKITTIDPAFDEKFINALQNVFPQDWFKCIQFASGTSRAVLPQINESYDLVYVDGDHSYEGTKYDIEQTLNKCTKFMLMDDYHLPTKDDPGIQCRTAIDEVNWEREGFLEPELIRMDRRIFMDERGLSDEQVNYGQVLATRIGTSPITRDDW